MGGNGNGSGNRNGSGNGDDDGNGYGNGNDSDDHDREKIRVSSPERWSRIPFHILEQRSMEEANHGENRRKRRICSDVGSAAAEVKSCIRDLPEPILAMIFACISDPRSRNSMALVCTEWYSLERATRTKLCLRGCVSDLYLIPKSFQAVLELNLAHCFPWGYSLFQTTSPERALLIAQALKLAFPRVKDMSVYVRDSRDIDMVAAFWPGLQELKLVRWHQRPIDMPPEVGPDSGLGMEFSFLMHTCTSLRKLDLSEFYCWSEDIPSALNIEPSVSRGLVSLKLMRVSDGFKASELEAIASACMNLEELWLVLLFNPQLLDFVDDDALLSLGMKCGKLRVLHLLDESDGRTHGEEAGEEEKDAGIGKHGLIGMFQALPFLEDLAIMLSHNVWDSTPILEGLASHCKRLTALGLGCFQGLCRGPQPDGLALCHGLSELMIENCTDLNDVGLSAIARGNVQLRKLGLHRCKGITRDGLHIVMSQLRRTLVNVHVTCCFQLSSIDTLWALQPVQSTIEELHIDCVVQDQDTIMSRWAQAETEASMEGSHDGVEQGIPAFSLSFCNREWSRLRCLSLWAPIGELLSPLPKMGLSICPALSEVRVKVEGDCRACPKPSAKLSGLGAFASYPALSKLTLDCSEMVGYALSAPVGHMELSLWQRWYMLGIQQLPLLELDYWPPQDRDANTRGISLPCAGLISQCLGLRKFVLHGTINEHMLRMFLKMPNLRDVQLRIDYYPAPEVELNTEMRADACRRFEAALSARGFPD